MKQDSASGSDATAQLSDKTPRRPHPYRRGSPTHPFATDGWPGRAAPRSPGQPPIRAIQERTVEGKTIPFRIPREELEAQSVACTHLVRACRQAIDELSLDGQHDARTNERATAILRDIQTEWSTALKALRRLSRR